MLERALTQVVVNVSHVSVYLKTDICPGGSALMDKQSNSIGC